MSLFRFAIAVFVGVAFVHTPVSAQQPRKAVGVLTCTSSQGTGLDAAQAVSCAFEPDGGKQAERYIGLINAGKAATEKRVLVWSVVTVSNAAVGPGALAQRYAAAAEAPMLVGASSPIALQSEKSTGAGDILELELRLASRGI